MVARTRAQVLQFLAHCLVLLDLMMFSAIAVADIYVEGGLWGLIYPHGYHHKIILRYSKAVSISVSESLKTPSKMIGLRGWMKVDLASSGFLNSRAVEKSIEVILLLGVNSGHGWMCEGWTCSIIPESGNINSGMEEGILQPDKLSNKELRASMEGWSEWGKQTRFYQGSEYTGFTIGSYNTWVDDIKFYSKVIYSILSFRILKNSNIISLCLGLRDNQYSPLDHFALKNLQSDVPEKKSDFTEVTYVSNF